MRDLKYITSEQYAQAMLEELNVRGLGKEFNVRADYVSEYARQLLVSMYGENVYFQGLKVYTTVKKVNQEAATAAVRRGILEYDLRHGYRGPEGFVNLPKDPIERKRALDEALIEHPSSDDLQAGVVLAVAPKEIHVFMASGDTVSIKGEALKLGLEGLSERAQPKIQIKPGSIVRVYPHANGGWQLAQNPEVESGLISVNTETGAILAMVGGFDFKRNQFNHAIQAERQPGSSFKPFIYAAAIEKGVMPQTIVNDAPLSLGGGETGGKAWEPKNYDGTYGGPMSVRTALARSKNLVSVRLIRAIGPTYTREFIQKFGFEPEKHPPYLTMALGAGSVTPIQMATAYSVFANGGFKIEPYLISKIIDGKGRVIYQAEVPEPRQEVNRTLDAKTAFVADSLMLEVTRSGTAATARVKLGRSDIAGKTGTTNDSHDAWFAGYHPKIAAVVWMGFDKPKSLGGGETGGGLSLPIWINYMSKALQGVPDGVRTVPEGVSNESGDWSIPEFANHPRYSSLD
jgi:penicillin-binding protein 1A